MKILLLILACLVAIFLIVRATMPPPVAPVRPATPEEAKANALTFRQRLVFQNFRSDDAEREISFRESIRTGGFRCDTVTRALSPRRGTWDVECAPGYIYRIRFDEEALPSAFEKLR